MPAIRLNGEQREAAAATVADMLAECQVPAGRGVAVAVNGQVVPSSTWPRHRLMPGDEVEIVRPIGGG